MLKRRRCCCTFNDICNCNLCDKDIARGIIDSFNLQGPYYNPVYFENIPPVGAEPKYNLDYYSNLDAYGDLILNKSTSCSPSPNVGYTTVASIDNSRTNFFGNILARLNLYGEGYGISYDCVTAYLAGTMYSDPSFGYLHPTITIGDPAYIDSDTVNYSPIGSKVTFNLSWAIDFYTVIAKGLKVKHSTFDFATGATTITTIFDGASTDSYLVTLGQVSHGLSFAHNKEFYTFHPFNGWGVQNHYECFVTTPQLITSKNCCVSQAVNTGSFLGHLQGGYSTVFVGDGAWLRTYQDINKYEMSLPMTEYMGNDGALSTNLEVVCV